MFGHICMHSSPAAKAALSLCWTHLRCILLVQCQTCLYKPSKFHNVTGLVHAEIVEFCRFLEPTAQEAAMREAATERVRQAIMTIFPTASVQVFGSFVTGSLLICRLCIHPRKYNAVHMVAMEPLLFMLHHDSLSSR